MKGTFKWVAGILAALILLVIVAVVLVGALINPNDYKPRIEKIAAEQAGIELKIGGDIGWSIFPWLGLEVGQLSARLPGQDQLAAIDSAGVAVKLLPLLSGRVEADTLYLDGLDLNLVMDASGQANWPAGDTLQGQGAESAATTEPAMGNVNETGAGGADLQLAINAIRIDNGRISYTDMQNQQKFVLSNLNVNGQQISTTDFFPAELGFRAEVFQGDLNTPSLTTTAKLDTRIKLDLAAQRYQLNELLAMIDVSGKDLGIEPQSLKLKANIDADMAQQVVKVSALQAEIAELLVRADVQVENLSTPLLIGTLEIPAFNPRNTIKALGMRDVLPPMADSKALTKVSLNGQFSGPANTVTLKPFALTLDDTQFNGRVGFDLASGKQLVVLNGDKLNLDRYLPPQAEGEAAAAPAAEGGTGGEPQPITWSKEEIIPVEPLKALNLDAELGLAQLQAQGIELGGLKTTVNAANGVVKSAVNIGKFYEGSAAFNVTLNASRSPLQLAINEDINSVQVGPLLKAVADTDAVSGAFTSSARLTAQGQSMHSIINSLNGKLSVNAADGVIQGIDMAQTVCQGFNTLGSLGINTTQVDKSTPFANLGGNFTIRNGVVSNNDLGASLDAIKLAGRGMVDLPKTLIDYRLGLTIEENLFKQSCSVNNRIEGVEWPVNCKGAFHTPPAQMCKPDLSAFKEVFRKRVESKAKEKIQEKIGDKLKDKLGGEGGGDLIKGLFGR